jgi:two-component system chemotaxis response regulator CheY
MAKILIVEDEAHIVRVMSMWLERHGHQIRQAPNGAAALDVLGRESVDMIISDINMPLLDGLGLVKAVRNERRLDIPILLVSARCDQAKLAEQLEPYDVRLYPKPFVPSRLVGDIERMLGVATS